MCVLQKRLIKDTGYRVRVQQFVCNYEKKLCKYNPCRKACKGYTVCIITATHKYSIERIISSYEKPYKFEDNRNLKAS